MADASSERPADDKLSHAEVHYERPSEHAGQYCGNCKHVIETLHQVRCESVASPIYLNGWCVRWEHGRA
jgi:hypothetical protein